MNALFPEKSYQIGQAACPASSSFHTYIAALLVFFSVWGIHLSHAADDIENIRKSIAELSSPDPDVRWQAVEKLGRGGQKVVPHLINELKTADFDKRRLIVESISIIDYEAVEHLVAAAKNNDPNVRLGVAMSLSRIPERRCIETLGYLLEDSVMAVRKSAVEGLLKIGDSSVIDQIGKALDDPNPELRRIAAEAMMKIKGPASIKYLIEALQDRSALVRKTVSEALWEMRNTDEIKDILESIKEPTDPKKRKHRLEIISTVVNLYPFLIRLGQQEHMEHLLTALSKYGSKEMANDFLNCGNRDLENAALDWSFHNGYTLLPTPGISGPKWGIK